MTASDQVPWLQLRVTSASNRSGDRQPWNRTSVLGQDVTVAAPGMNDRFSVVHDGLADDSYGSGATFRRPRMQPFGSCPAESASLRPRATPFCIGAVCGKTPTNAESVLGRDSTKQNQSSPDRLRRPCDQQAGRQQWAHCRHWEPSKLVLNGPASAGRRESECLAELRRNRVRIRRRKNLQEAGCEANA